MSKLPVGILIVLTATSVSDLSSAISNAW